MPHVTQMPPTGPSAYSRKTTSLLHSGAASVSSGTSTASYARSTESRNMKQRTKSTSSSGINTAATGRRQKSSGRIGTDYVRYNTIRYIKQFTHVVFLSPHIPLYLVPYLRSRRDQLARTSSLQTTIVFSQ